MPSSRLSPRTASPQKRSICGRLPPGPWPPKTILFHTAGQINNPVPNPSWNIAVLATYEPISRTWSGQTNYGANWVRLALTHIYPTGDYQLAASGSNNSPEWYAQNVILTPIAGTPALWTITDWPATSGNLLRFQATFVF